MNFAEKLKELRLSKGISQAKLAQDIFVSRSAVAKWENGLGIPNDDSLEMLAEYFHISVEELLYNKESEEILVSKNKMIDVQQRVIKGFLITVVVVLGIIVYMSYEPIREYVSMIVIGILICSLGIFNIQGNIASIHWYNRRKVSKEDQLPYARLMGIGTFIIGITMILSACIQTLGNIELGAQMILIGIVIGLTIMIYAQYKYNKGIF